MCRNGVLFIIMKAHIMLLSYHDDSDDDDNADKGDDEFYTGLC